MSDNKMVTKEYLQKYHEHLKQMALKEKYKALEKNDQSQTIVDAINDKLSKDDKETWDENNFPYNDK